MYELHNIYRLHGKYVVIIQISTRYSKHKTKRRNIESSIALVSEDAISNLNKLRFDKAENTYMNSIPPNK